jgi:RNA polymerase sigma-B factor
MRTLTRELLILNHLPLARALALRYRGRGTPHDDLFQVASVGLVKAADRWDPERGTTFATYAVPTILGELRRHFRDATWDVRPPRRIQEMHLVASRTRDKLTAALGREPTVAELAERLERPEEEIAEALQAGHGRRLAPLDEAVTSSGEDAAIEAVEARVSFQQLTARLDTRAREIVRLRFEDELHQREIAQRVGVTQVAVSRSLGRSLEKLAAGLQPLAAAA